MEQISPKFSESPILKATKRSFLHLPADALSLLNSVSCMSHLAGIAEVGPGFIAPNERTI